MAISRRVGVGGEWGTEPRGWLGNAVGSEREGTEDRRQRSLSSVGTRGWERNLALVMALDIQRCLYV